MTMSVLKLPKIPILRNKESPSTSSDESTTPIEKKKIQNLPSTTTFVPILYKFADYFGLDRDLCACTLCELFCTFFLMYGGTSLQAVKTLGRQNFEYGVPMGWGLWLIFCLYIGFNISGAHLNPAISFMFYFVFGRISFKRFVCYSIAQVTGFFLGSALTYLVYYECFNDFDGGVRTVDGPNGTAGIFAPYPKPYLSITGAFIDQLVTTGVLCFKVLAIIDEKNRIPRQIQPLLLGISLWTIIAFWSYNCGASLNPARDFGPRLFTFLAGWGIEVFSYRNYQWFIVPLTAPMFGSVLGGYAYNRIIGDYVVDRYSKISKPTLLPLFDRTPVDKTINKSIPLANVAFKAQPLPQKTFSKVYNIETQDPMHKLNTQSITLSKNYY